jgi:hypothetical protein
MIDIDGEHHGRWSFGMELTSKAPSAKHYGSLDLFPLILTVPAHWSCFEGLVREVGFLTEVSVDLISVISDSAPLQRRVEHGMNLLFQ